MYLLPRSFLRGHELVIHGTVELVYSPEYDDDKFGLETESIL